MRVVGPLLFQATFNYAPYPPVHGLSYRLYGLAPMGSRRFTGSSGTSLSADHPVDRVRVVSGPLPGLSPGRISRPILPVGGGTFLSQVKDLTVGRPPSPSDTLKIYRYFICCMRMRRSLQDIGIFFSVADVQGVRKDHSIRISAQNQYTNITEYVMYMHKYAHCHTRQMRYRKINNGLGIERYGVYVHICQRTEQDSFR